MKANRRLILLALVVIVAIVVIAVMVGGKKEKQVADDSREKRLDKNTTVISGEKLAEVKESSNLQFSNIQIKLNSEEGSTIVSAEVANQTSQTTPSQYIDFCLLDKDGKELRKIGANVNSLKPGEKTAVTTNIKTAEIDHKADDVKVVAQPLEINN